MLVGEVRCAATGSGVSWKLSGGSTVVVRVTKVSKNRQVRRAIRRKACASASASGRRPATRGDRLAQSATAGETTQARCKAAAERPRACRRPCRYAIAAPPITTAPAMRR